MNSVGTRDDFIHLLEQLGAEDERLVLETARELHRRVVLDGDGWGTLLVSDTAEPGGLVEEPAEDELSVEEGLPLDDDLAVEDDPAPEDELTADDEPATDDELADEDLDDGAEPTDESVDEIEVSPDAIEASAEDLATLERLLRRTDISAATREELEGLRSDIADGDFSEMDASYLRALAERLGRN